MITSKMKPLNGQITHPLSAHAIEQLQTIAKHTVPCSSVNTGVGNRLMRDHLIDIVDLQSPFKLHKGRNCPHYRITEAGKLAIADTN